MLTPVKDQGRYGTCWSFACMGALESSLLKAGLGTFSLSEWHLAYFAYHPFNTSLMAAFTPGQVGEEEDPVFDQGGNDLISTALLSRGTGAVNEKDCPYQAGPYRAEPRPAGDLPNGRENVSVPLEETILLFEEAGPSAPSDIKYALTHYGPTVISIDWEDKSFDETQNTFRDPTATLGQLNHEVCIVGWNDRFEPCRFPAENRPDHPGAWIVRNSWSRDWGKDGYFYLSYDSKLFDGTVFRGGTRTCRKVHQYDPLGWCSGRGFGSDTALCANLFRAETRENVTAVAFYAIGVDTAYQITVLPEITGEHQAELAAVDNLAASSQGGAFHTPGYHVVTLNHPVPIRAGAEFAVKVQLTTPNYLYPIPVQDPEEGYSTHSAAHHGRSYISPDGQHWQDLAPNCAGASLCVKALADVTNERPGGTHP
jgi:C1A family cysteine protease